MTTPKQLKDPKSRMLKNRIKRRKMNKLGTFYLYPLLMIFVLWIAFGLQFLCDSRDSITLGVFSFVVGMFLAGNKNRKNK